MTEILTESFCERCGTRYTFQTAAPRRGGMKRLKVLSRGLKNYVLSDETTLEEALADARSDEERSISSEQLDAFHQTFNFCMSCRQYTCGNCWNAPENLCLTCAPDLSRDILPAAFPDLDPMAGVTPFELPSASSTPVNEDRAALAAAAAWPGADLAPAPEPEPAPELAPEVMPAVAAQPEPEPASEPVVEAPIAAMAMPAPEAAPEPEPVEATADSMPVAPLVGAPTPIVRTTPPAVDDRAAAAAAQTAALLARFRPDHDLDQALAEFEREVGEGAPAGAEAVAAEASETGATIADAAVAATVTEVALEPAAVEAEAAASAEPEPAPALPERRDDRVEIPVWRITAPDPTATTPSAAPPVVTPSTTPSTPAWPPQAAAPGDGSAPQWPSAAFLTPAPVSRARDAMWAAQSLELVEKAGGGVQSCVSCGLPLSATARFCRRCGSRQG